MTTAEKASMIIRDIQEEIRCSYSDRNAQCIRPRCPFFPEKQHR